MHPFCRTNGKPWKHVATEFLLNFRATPHSTTGVSPSELLHHCKMHTKLKIFPVGPKSDKCAQINYTVRNKQLKSKRQKTWSQVPHFQTFVLSEKNKWNASKLTHFTGPVATQCEDLQLQITFNPRSSG